MAIGAGLIDRGLSVTDTDGSDLVNAMVAVNSLPLWDRYKRLNTHEPKQHEAILWPWSKMAGLVDRASREVSMEDAERRALLLVHPGYPGTIFTTPTLSGALQVLEPGEVAGPHRHTLAALRLVMIGEGAETVVDGKSCRMEPGDLVLTPAWSWHEHRHYGNTRMVWFDGLDYPLCRQIETVFFEIGPGPVPPRGIAALADDGLAEGGMLPEGAADVVPYSPLYRYAWSRAAKVLGAMPAAADGSRQLRYVNPANGGPVMPTIDCCALRPGVAQPTTAARTTATAMAVVIEGEGESRIGEQTIKWRQHDVFTLPRWQWISHEATRGPATLFLMSDRELLARIDHLREETASQAPARG